MHPEGTFQGKITEHGLQEPRKPDGYWQVVIGLQSEAGTIHAYWSLHPNSEEYTAKKVRKAGFRSLAEVEDRETLVGVERAYGVKHELGTDGKTRAVVKWIGEPREVRWGRADEESRRRFDALMAKVDGGQADSAADDDQPF